MSVLRLFIFIDYDLICIFYNFTFLVLTFLFNNTSFKMQMLNVDPVEQLISKRYLLFEL